MKPDIRDEVLQVGWKVLDLKASVNKQNISHSRLHFILLLMVGLRRLIWVLQL